MESGQGCVEEKSSSVCETLIEQNDGESSKSEILQMGTSLDQQTPGKQKKTSFKFFGGRKSICTLPSFFGGKHKGLGKRNSKKLLSKSKTHDCISNVPGEDGKSDYTDSAISRPNRQDMLKPGNTLPSSHSADSGITSPVKLDFNFHDISPMGSTECFDKKLNAEKSFSFPRPKKGLKGLFSSIRRHKKNKTPDLEKCEQHDHHTQSIILEQLNNTYETEDGNLQGNSEQPKITKLESELSPACPLNVTVVSEKEELQSVSECLTEMATRKNEELLEDTSEGLSLQQDLTTESRPDCSIDCPTSENVFPESCNSDYIDRHTPPNYPGDQLSLMFEDVSSLKSFDSLTGCGDIIAEQDIDNISDNSVSIERSREATKRSSCLVTYQGGGEEMATPDDMEEEYLQQLLEDCNEPEVGYELEDEKEQDEMSKGFTEMEANAVSLGAEDAFVDRTVLSNIELLSPQSDQQESAPNSDEGYYDSTTPGPDEEAGVGFSQKERLPRDSYSGDALYEFYEPDDSLMSPAPGGESLYDGKTLCSEIFDQFFDFSLPIDSGSIHNPGRKKGATETEEERLAVIQKQLLLWERQREAVLKGMGHLNKDMNFKQKPTNECEISTVNLGKSKDCSLIEQVLLPNVNKGDGDQLRALSEKQNWKDSFTESIYQGSYIQRSEKDCNAEKPGFELNVVSLEAQDQNDPRMTSVTKVSNPNIEPMHRVQNVFGSKFDHTSGYSQENECEQAVNFSQTLVEFAKNSMLFSSISERLGLDGSNNSFHQNLNSLPTMVTFDIVDVENEGECEQQLEHSSDEKVVSSFEEFEYRYVQESLAECDEQLLQMDSHNAIHSYNWGVASLPRHLDQYKLSPSRPVPLSLNRRSKSLDTESLEFELGGLPVSKSGLKSYDLLTPWEHGKNTWQYEDTCVVADETVVNSCSLDRTVHTNGQFQTYTSILSSKQEYSREPWACNSSSQLSMNNRQMAKTTTELLKCNTRLPQEGSGSYPYFRENTRKKLARVLPMEEQRGVETNYDYHASNKQIKAKPVGITQAMPQQHKKEDFNPLADFLDRSGPAKKGILEQRATLPNDWTNYNECTNG